MAGDRPPYMITEIRSLDVGRCSRSLQHTGQTDRHRASSPKDAAVRPRTCTKISLSWLTSPKSRHLLLRRLYRPSPRVPATAISTPSGLMDACVRGYRAAMYCWGTRMCCTPSWGPAACWLSLGSGANRLLGLPVAASLTTNSLSSACKQPKTSSSCSAFEHHRPIEWLQAMLWTSVEIGSPQTLHECLQKAPTLSAVNDGILCDAVEGAFNNAALSSWRKL